MLTYKANPASAEFLEKVKKKKAGSARMYYLRKLLLCPEFSHNYFYE